MPLLNPFDVLNAQYAGDYSTTWSGFNVAASTVSGVNVVTRYGGDQQMVEIVALDDDIYVANTVSTPASTTADTTFSGIVASGHYVPQGKSVVLVTQKGSDWIGIKSRTAVQNEIRIRSVGRRKEV